MRDLMTETQTQTPDGFIAGAQTAATENLPAPPLIYAAYGGIWLVLLLYIFMLWRKLQRVEKDLRDLPSTRSAPDRR